MKISPERRTGLRLAVPAGVATLLVILALILLSVPLTHHAKRDSRSRGSLPARAAAAQAQDSPRLTLLFAGDVMLARGVGRRMVRENDWDYPFRRIRGTLHGADLAFANLECPVSDAGRDMHHLYSFRADPGAIESLKFAGFSVVSVANNHVEDWGRDALLDTVARLRSAGIQPVGAGADDAGAHQPVVVNLDGVRVAVLAYVGIPPRSAAAGPQRAGVAWLDPERVLADVGAARQTADLVIVYFHWGVEYATEPQADQVKLAHRVIDGGADLLVGSHPHVAQPLERYHGRWIAYSLGNFVFDQSGPNTHRGLLLKALVRGKQITEVASLPIKIGSTFQAEIAPKELPQLGPKASGQIQARSGLSPAPRESGPLGGDPPKADSTGR